MDTPSSGDGTESSATNLKDGLSENKDESGSKYEFVPPEGRGTVTQFKPKDKKKILKLHKKYGSNSKMVWKTRLAMVAAKKGVDCPSGIDSFSVHVPHKNEIIDEFKYATIGENRYQGRYRQIFDFEDAFNDWLEKDTSTYFRDAFEQIRYEFTKQIGCVQVTCMPGPPDPDNPNQKPDIAKILYQERDLLKTHRVHCAYAAGYVNS